MSEVRKMTKKELRHTVCYQALGVVSASDRIVELTRESSELRDAHRSCLAELEKVREQRESARKSFDRARGDRSLAIQRAEQAEAEVERLKARIATDPETGLHGAMERAETAERDVEHLKQRMAGAAERLNRSPRDAEDIDAALWLIEEGCRGPGS